MFWNVKAFLNLGVLQTWALNRVTVGESSLAAVCIQIDKIRVRAPVRRYGNAPRRLPPAASHRTPMLT